MTGLQFLLGAIVTVPGVVLVLHMIGVELGREIVSLLGEGDCSVWECPRPARFTEPDGTPRCMAHVGRPTP